MKSKGRQSKNIIDLRRMKLNQASTLGTMKYPDPPIPKRVSDDLENAARRQQKKGDRLNPKRNSR